MRFRVVALGANRSVDELARQADALRPEVVAIGDDGRRRRARVAPRAARRRGARRRRRPRLARRGRRRRAQRGRRLRRAAGDGRGALRSGRRLALANKESLIAGAPVVQAARATPGAEIVPVDSEHCAIHQCLGERRHVDADGARPIGAPSRPADVRAAGRHRERRAVPRSHGRDELGDGDRRRGARPPDVEDGAEDHDRLVDADEQGPRGDRGARAVRRRLRPDRGRRPPAVDRPLDGRVLRRGDDRPALRCPTCACRSATRLPTRSGFDRPSGRSTGASSLGSTSTRRTSRPSPASRLAYEAGRAGGERAGLAERRQRGRGRRLPRRADRAGARSPTSSTRRSTRHEPTKLVEVDDVLAADAAGARRRPLRSSPRPRAVAMSARASDRPTGGADAEGATPATGAPSSACAVVRRRRSSSSPSSSTAVAVLLVVAGARRRW